MEKTTPAILFLIFNRPEPTRKVFEAIAQAKPRQLFIAADGPRTDKEGEAENCAAARSVVQRVSWDCEVKTLFREENLGCRKAISSAIDWFFEHVEEGIILEDDCLPHPSFFGYCGQLLERFRFDDRIWNISGSDFTDHNVPVDGSYYFSSYFNCWGWATWKRAWMHYDDAMQAWPLFRDASGLSALFNDPLEVKYWETIFETLWATSHPDTWDYRWILTCWENHKLTVIPNKNMISNIGFGASGTHTLCSSNPLGNRPIDDIGPLTHPQQVVRNRAAERYMFDHTYKGLKMRQQQTWWFKTKKRLYGIKKRLQICLKIITKNN